MRSLGKQIPDDYSIACFDHPDSHYNNYFFTHIKQDEIKIGRQAVELLIRQIKNNSVEVKNIIDYSLIEGKTTSSFFKKLDNLENIDDISF